MCQIDENYKSPEQVIDEETGVSVEDRLKRLEKKSICFHKKLERIISLLETAAEYERRDHQAKVGKAIRDLYDKP